VVVRAATADKGRLFILDLVVLKRRREKEEREKFRRAKEKQVRLPGGLIGHSGAVVEFFRDISRGIQRGVECLRPQGWHPVDRYLVLSADNRMTCQRCRAT
jgi:hypothetical protein